MATTKKDLVDHIAGHTGDTHRLTKAVVQAFLNEVIHELGQDNRIELRDFGVFTPKTTPARIARNPKTLEQILIPASRRAVFKPGRLLKSQVNGCLKR